ncbi:MAG TPA: hypothetical protein VIQ30_04625 [Pseudonocardia sp.]
MSQVPSPIEVTTWPQVAALALLLAAFVIVPAVIGYLQLRATKGATRTAEAAAEVAASAEVNATKTLNAVTKKNGGNSMPDRFDKQDRYFKEIFDRLDKLDGVPRAVDVAVHPVEIEKGTES